jgi:hypothetical protein
MSDIHETIHIAKARRDEPRSLWHPLSDECNRDLSNRWNRSLFFCEITQKRSALKASSRFRISSRPARNRARI